MRAARVLLGVLAGLISTAPLAENVTMAFSQRIPPYTFPATDRGVEIDVAREALALRGHTLVPHYFPLERLALAFRYGRVDATMMDLGEDLTEAGGHYADPAVIYENVLISLAERRLKIESAADMAGKLVIGFLGSGSRYAEWSGPSKLDGLFFESTDQELQTLGLLRGHFDFMLTDRYIFHYFAQKLARERGIEVKPVNEFHFVTINPQHYRPVFRDARIRDDFNAGLKALKESGRFDEIYNIYLQTPAPMSQP